MHTFSFIFIAKIQKHISWFFVHKLRYRTKSLQFDCRNQFGRSKPNNTREDEWCILKNVDKHVKRETGILVY